MALKDKIAVGISLPHRSPDPIDMAAVERVAQRAEALGFSDLWVTENTLDHVFCFDPGVILSYAAAITRRIRLGVAVTVLPVHNPSHVANQMATLDYVSHGRAILGIGLGREHHYADFQVPMERRVRRFREGVEIIRALWTQAKVDYQGDIFRLHGAEMMLKPVQKPHPPIWFGGDHPDAIRRAATLADGWMGSGGSSIAGFGKSVPLLRAELEKVGRDPARFPISKRVFLSVAERADAARAELDRWFVTVYRNPVGAEASGIYGTPGQVREKLEALVAVGANHLLVNPVACYADQVEALAEVVGLT
ncbi:MAG TPA: LLM class flavin-dependent oxidoreductase [Burkholderiales bacterium]|nr:LLM class flavin-dependent oxidoreductase [Burkholderiales bacterium]